MILFRLLADLSHLASIGLLIWALHTHRSAAGVSLKTQIVYFLVFATRYLDLVLAFSQNAPLWSIIGKLVFLGTAAYLVYLIGVQYRASYDKWLDTMRLRFLVPPCLVLAVIFTNFSKYSVLEYFWTYSVIQESVAVLPQLVLLTRTGDRTVLSSHYLLALGLYRFLYLLNWIFRLATDDSDKRIEWQLLVFGAIQTALYLDFVWIYRNRQAISFDDTALRREDAETHGFLLRYIMRSKTLCPERDESGRPLHMPLGGYSVSAATNAGGGGQARPPASQGGVDDRHAKDALEFNMS